MSGTEKRLLTKTLLLGLLLSGLVVAAERLGLLDPLERYLYDWRARHCQLFTLPATDQIVHLDIDDAALGQIGAFPWPRTVWAEMIDEIRLAGARTIGLDVFFPEPQQTRYIRQPDGSFVEVNDDENFARAIRRAGNVLIPASVKIEPGQSETLLQLSESARRLMEFGIEADPGQPLLRARGEPAAIPSLLQAARYSGLVEFVPSPDGVVRSVPLLFEYRGRLLPHMALAAVCAQLDVDLKQMQIRPDALLLPVRGAEAIVIPVRTVRSRRHGQAGFFMDVPWFGASSVDGWLTMYDYPTYSQPRQHISVGNVWAICQSIRDMEKNCAQMDEAIRSVNQVYPSAQTSAYLTMPVEQRDQARTAVVEAVLKDLSELGVQGQAETREEKMLLAAQQALLDGAEANRQLADQIAQARSVLRAQLQGRYALIGWTATGMMRDAYPTSLHPLCPGVAIQGAIFNAVMTRQFWTAAPWWLGAVITMAVGLATTLVVSLLPAYRALLCTALLAGGYLAMNGIVFFDYGDYVVQAAAPLSAATLVWFGVTMARFIHERRERSRITRRFSSYVDPALVNWVIEHPEQARFDGQVKQITVAFTDLDGFTALSEKLRESTVPLLNEYMSLMLPIIRRNRGYWNKFLGDGIMFFFNAPADNDEHAIDAVRTVLQMQQAMGPFNQRLVQRGLPVLSMRAGVSTGMMVVGDAGSSDPSHNASDYTVLGDEVNLASRLESANKHLGTRVLIGPKTAELVCEQVLLRPVGLLKVAGREAGVLAWEALCLKDQAGDREKHLVELSRRMVDLYSREKFAACIETADEIDRLCGFSKLARLYIAHCRRHLSQASPEEFDGLIVLSEK